MHYRFIILFSFLFNISLGGITGKLSGIITETNSDNVLIGCNIIINGTDLGTASDINGQYFLLNIPPGIYDVKFQMIGYETLIINNVQISIDRTTKLNANLQMAVIEGSEIVVTADRKLIEFDVTQSESRITAEELESMPVAEVSDVLRLQGGITQDASGGLHMRGGRSNEIAYMVDGVPMTDAYNGGISVQIENDNIQELQIISGTFNAEYGKALTGVVNMVTKDGGDNFEGFINFYSGDHTTSDSIFPNLDSYRIDNDYSISGNISGPIIPGLVTFYSSARINRSAGWLNGLNTFTMYGDTIFYDNNNNYYRDNNEPLKNPQYESLNWYDSWSTQNKITFRLRPMTRLKINTILNSGTSQGYDHNRQMTHEGRKKNFDYGAFVGLNLSHSFSPLSFMDLYLTEYTHRFQSYVFEEPLDNRYITPDSLYWAHIEGKLPDEIINKYGSEVNYFPQYTVARWGIDTDRFERETKSRSLRLDATSQINKYNQIKFGFDITKHQLSLDTYALLDSSQADQVFTPLIPQVGSFNRSTYEFNPEEISFYIQDKIEYGDMIINVGLRYEIFNPKSHIPTNIHEPYIHDPRNPALDTLSIDELENIRWGDISYTDEDSLGNPQSHTFAEYYDRFNDQPDLASKQGWWKKTQTKSQLSPRLAVAYPISDKGVIHFAYGYFFKIPDFSMLYNNTEYKLTETGTNFGIFGNPDLQPETTISYELGLRQEVASRTRLELKGFYRDARDYVSSGIPIDLGDGKNYYTYVNKDYSNSRGLILSFYRQFSNYMGWHLDYTYQVAEGSNSDPSEEFGAVLAGKEPSRSIIPLDWDQTHNLNGSIQFGYNGWGANTIFQYGSGYPYTPFITNYEQQGEVLSNVLIRNSRRKPMSFRLDIKLFKHIEFSGMKGKLYMNIYNLLDRRNEIVVYGDTGRTDETIEKARAEIISPFEPLRPNTIYQFFNRPDWYDEPREIQFGFQFSW